ncbi:uncharacterized protein LOC111716430 [Eurytemora carolleeae]|uniref:uncharacterized protein LOC111716430 n=1 Tax=Eurytemora carolleeae TaxID=1294199 RepID=UPI000C790B5D|nr:uncharacterized protein LOC111716430 [Eurytemora carolleeae]|eukprot:XP_023347654.1 uncharacterized protein LOC111716430 [Eurytemora affinis]
MFGPCFPRSESVLTSYTNILSPLSPELHSFGTDEYETENSERNDLDQDKIEHDASTIRDHSSEHSILLTQENEERENNNVPGSNAEPLCFPIFSWTLISVGIGMLMVILLLFVQLALAVGREIHQQTSQLFSSCDIPNQ